ncbi:MAG: caspase family protein [Planctomycetes bacterium]|nr:caspase family protein [Planctomycetota bacterium]NOG54770.1 caspase family protein [Planctomycetota bacterium]
MAASSTRKRRNKKSSTRSPNSHDNKKMRVLCVHGVGNHSRTSEWKDKWTKAIEWSVVQWNPTISVETDFVMYDDIFEHHPVDPITIAGAVTQLLSSGIVHGIGDLFRTHRGMSRGLFDIPDTIRWTAGMVAQWAASESLRREARKRMADHVISFKPDVIAAHSLGSLVCYDAFIPRSAELGQAAQTFTADRTAFHELLHDRFFLTFGSQIGNPFVRGTFGGRLMPLHARFWYHLFNPKDDVLTSEVPIEDDGFRQLTTEFDLPGWGDHSAWVYLSSPNAVTGAWRRMVQAIAAGRGGFDEQSTVISPTIHTPEEDFATACSDCGDPLFASDLTFTHICRKPRRRALLVGINTYPNEADCLEGCINDVYLMNSILQELGFAAEDIRLAFDDRASTDGIRDRLHWLLDGVRAGDERLFFYSGHGAQMPGYGIGETVDRLDECLVPYDFDWTPAHAVLDDEIFDLYSQLPYESHFVMVLDCCHSGGMTRDGGARVRGLAPPDDIRHRILQWQHSEERGQWTARTSIPSPNPSLAALDFGTDYLGQSKILRRFGRSIALRSLPNDAYDDACSGFGHHGPYLPLILQACQEHEYAYEYRHGSTPYGAFTFSMAEILRHHRQAGTAVTYEQLLTGAAARLSDLHYAQTPALVGPGSKRSSEVPFALGRESAGSKGPTRARKSKAKPKPKSKPRKRK